MTVAQESRAVFGQWLEAQFLAWQRQAGTRRSLAGFAHWLGVNRIPLSSWIAGKRLPRRQAAILLAAKLGGAVYDVLGLERPDPRIVQLQMAVDALPAFKRVRKPQGSARKVSNRP